MWSTNKFVVVAVFIVGIEPISSDGDDHMGAKVKTQKNPSIIAIT